jgi:hypothetical protein
MTANRSCSITACVELSANPKVVEMQP